MIPDSSTRGRRYKRLSLTAGGSSGKFSAMRSEQILQRPKDANSPQPKAANSRPLSSPLKDRLYLFEKGIDRIFVVLGLYALCLEQGFLFHQLIQCHCV